MMPLSLMNPESLQIFRSPISECSANANNRRLYSDVVLQRPGYDQFYPRPVLNNYSEPVIVYMNLSLTQILDVVRLRGINS